MEEMRLLRWRSGDLPSPNLILIGYRHAMRLFSTLIP
jgi:hypothetical protein